jgi:hypothetical protein
LPEPKSFNDQTTQTNGNETNDNDTTINNTVRNNDESSEFFSTSDDVESSRKRLHTDLD